MLRGLRRACSLLVDAVFAPHEAEVWHRESDGFELPEPVVVDVEVALGLGDGASELLAPVEPSRWLSGIQAELRAISRKRTAQARLVTRARIVLGVVFEHRPVSAVARQQQMSRTTVRLWVDRFRRNGTLESLDDRVRTGRPPRLTTRDQAVVLGLACRRPEDLGRLEGRMTHAIIAEEAAKQGVNLSRASVQRLLALAEVKPHRERYYLFTVKDKPEYIARRDALPTRASTPTTRCSSALTRRRASRRLASRRSSPMAVGARPRQAFQRGSTSTTCGTGRAASWWPCDRTQAGSLTVACSRPEASRALR